MQKHHPEQKDGEIFMGNASESEVQQSLWRSSRLGSVALTRSGESKISSRPWFVEAAEVERAIRSEKLNDRPWSPERISMYQGFLNHSHLKK